MCARTCQDSTWSYCHRWKHIQNSFLDDLKAKGPFISRADWQRVKAINKLHFHSGVPDCRLNEAHDLEKTSDVVITEYTQQNRSYHQVRG